MTIKNIGLAALVLGALLGAASFFGYGLHLMGVKFGTTGNAPETYYNGQWLVGGNQIGPTGTWNLNQQFASCNPKFYGTSFAASTTGVFACAAPGVNAGDSIVGDLPQGAGVNPSGAGSIGGGFVLVGAYSTTTGIVAFTIQNDTGAATSSFAQATTSFEYFTWR